MTATVGSLRVNLGLDSAQYQQGLKNASAQARRFEAEVGRSARGASNLNRALQSNAVRNFGLQFSQVVQQVQAGSGVLRSLAIQLPDIGLGFGTVGIAAGIVGGALLSVASGFFKVDEGVSEFADTLGRVKSLSQDLNDTFDLLSADTAELAETYGLAANRVREFGINLSKLQIGQASSRLNDLSFSLREVTGAFQDVLRDTREDVFSSVALREALQVTQEQLVSIAQAFRDIDDADNTEARQSALLNVLRVLEGSNVEISKLPDGLRDTVQEMILLSNETDRATEAMRQLGAEAQSVNTGVPLFNQNLGNLLPPAQRVAPSATGGARSRTQQLTDDQKELKRVVSDVQRALEAAEQQGLRRFEGRIDSVSDSITGAILGFQSFGDAIASVLSNIASQILSSGISNLLIGSLGGSLFGNLLGFATGTNYAPGGMALVGERGPEIVNLPRGSQVIPNHKLPTGGGGGVTVMQTINIAANGDDSVRRIVRSEAPKMAEMAKAAVLEARKRGGSYGEAF